MLALRRLLHRVPARWANAREIAFAAVWIGALLAIEWLGRTSASTWLDPVLVAGLAALGVGTVLADRRRRIGWWPFRVERIRAFGAGLARRWGRCGIDLRTRGERADRLPPSRVAVLLGAIAALATTIAWASAFPGWLRELGVRTSYTLYLCGITGLGGATAIVAIGWSFLAGAVVGDARLRAADNRRSPRRGRSPSVPVVLGVGLGSLGLALGVLPVEWAVAGTGAGLLVVMAVSRARRFERARVTWKGPGGTRRTISLGAHVRTELALVGIVPLVLVVLATGLDRGDAPGWLPVVVRCAGRACAWATTAALGLLAWRIVTLVRSLARDDAAAATRPVRFVRPPTAAERMAVAALGFTVRVQDAGPHTDDVVLDPDTHDPRTAAGRAWLVRRHELVARRLVRRGLRRMLRAAARFDFECGSGFWIAPHLWMVLGLVRDEEEDDAEDKGTGILDQVLGPDHLHAIPATARAHLTAVFAAVDIDLLFVEDGVRWPQLTAVLTVVYEVYDVHGGRRRVEDRDFAGLPGLRVVVHEFEVDNPLRAEGYPEPDYDDLARARVLHVFRDRGGDTAGVDVPADGDRVPLVV